MKGLRLYQETCLSSIFSYFEVHAGNPVVCVATGGGKSLIIAEFMRRVIEQWPDQRIMCLSHSKEIIIQNLEAAQEQNPTLKIGVYSAALNRRDTRAPLLFGSIQSCYKKPYVFGYVHLLLVDECHAIGDEGMYREIITGLRETNPRLKVIGFSATPYRLKTGLLTEGENRIFTDICAEITIAQLVTEGYLCPLVGKLSVTQADLSQVKTVAGEFNQKDAEEAFDLDELTNAALDEVHALASDRKSWIFFCSGIKHAEHVRDALRVRGVMAETVSSVTPEGEREGLLAAFERGEFQALTNADLLTTGWNCPRVDLIVMLRATQSPGLFVQIAGRGMRLYPGKSNCLFLDFGGNIERHGPITHVKPPRPAGQRTPSERNQATCIICPMCRMASPLGTLECADCGHSFERPERIKHDTVASAAEVMDYGREPDTGVWEQVDKIEYCRHQKPDKIPTLRVEYICGLNRYKEWICLEHPEGYARGKATDWWKRRVSGSYRVPDNIQLALFFADALKKPWRIKVKREDKYWRIVAYDFTGWSLKDQPLPETAMVEQLAEPIDFDRTY